MLSPWFGTHHWLGIMPKMGHAKMHERDDQGDPAGIGVDLAGLLGGRIWRAPKVGPCQ